MEHLSFKSKSICSSYNNFSISILGGEKNEKS